MTLSAVEERLTTLSQELQTDRMRKVVASVSSVDACVGTEEIAGTGDMAMGDMEPVMSNPELKDWLAEQEKDLRRLRQQLSEQQGDVKELRSRWVEQQYEHGAASVFVETRLTRFEGMVSRYFEELAREADRARAELVMQVEARLGAAVDEIARCSATAIEAREALTADIAKLHLERDAMRRAWQRIESLRNDPTWGYFLREDDEWRNNVSQRIKQVEDEVESGSGVWTEIGRLGCRIADFHRLVDERVGNSSAGVYIDEAAEKLQDSVVPDRHAPKSEAVGARTQVCESHGTSLPFRNSREGLPFALQEQQGHIRRFARKSCAEEDLSDLIAET